jgi:PAS domain S-box-containing protein
VLFDISDRKAAEAQLQVQESFLRSIYDGVAHRIFVLHVPSDGKVAYSGHNRAAEHATGRTSESVINVTPTEMFGPAEGAAIEATCQQCIASKQAITQEEHLTLNGQESWVLTTFTPLQDATGRVHRIIGTSFDITPLKQAQAELKTMLQELQRTQSRLVQSEKMSSLGQLVAGVAHEINNPVNFIYGNLAHARHYTEDLLNLVDLFQNHYPTPNDEIQSAIEEMDLEFVMADLPKLLHSMKVGAERIQGIVSSLRTFSRMDEAEMKAVNLHDGLESTLMILQNRLKARSHLQEIQIHRHYGDLPRVECYPGQLNQVFMNILTNAIDALEEVRSGEIPGKPEAWIAIATAIKDQQVHIHVQDNGQGIAGHHLSRLFDPFFTTKPIGKGTGMGLSISYQIVTEKHGGQLTCESTLGQGTTFRIVIPLQQSA